MTNPEPDEFPFFLLCSLAVFGLLGICVAAWKAGQVLWAVIRGLQP